MPRSASSRSKTGSPKPGGDPARHRLHHAAHGVARLSNGVDEIDHGLRDLLVRTAHDIAFHLVAGHRRRVDLRLDVTNSFHIGHDLDGGRLGEQLARDGAGRDPADGFARAGSTASRHGANAVLGLIAVVGVRRTVLGTHLVVVASARIAIAHQQRDGRAQGQATLDAGKNLDLVRLVAVAGNAALARSATVQLDLDLLAADGEARGTPVDHDADTRPVGLAPGRDPEELAEGTCQDKWLGYHSRTRTAAREAFCF